MTPNVSAGSIRGSSGAGLTASAGGGAATGTPWMAIAYAAKTAAEEIKSVVTKVLGAVKDAVDKVAESFTTLKNIIIDTVGAFQPFAIVQFNRALLDLQATFGAIFLPILKNATALVRSLADAIYSLPSGIKELIRNLVDFALRFSGLVVILTTVVGAVGGFVTAILAIGAAIYMATAALIAFLPLIISLAALLMPFVVIFAAIGTAVVAVTAILIELAKIFFNTAGGAKLLHNIMHGFGQMMKFLETTFSIAMRIIAPIIDLMKSALSDLGDALSELFDAIKPLLAAGLVPIIAVIAAGLTVLAAVITGVAKVVEFLTRAFLFLLGPLGTMMKMFGGAMPGTEQKSSFGLGWAQPKVDTDMNAMFNRITEEVLKNSRLGGDEKVEDPNTKTANYVAKWSDNLAKALEKYLRDEGGSGPFSAGGGTGSGVTGPFSAAMWLGKEARSIFR